jgi:hypothetical protein
MESVLRILVKEQIANDSLQIWIDVTEYANITETLLQPYRNLLRLDMEIAISLFTGFDTF